MKIASSRGVLAPTASTKIGNFLENNDRLDSFVTELQYGVGSMLQGYVSLCATTAQEIITEFEKFSFLAEVEEQTVFLQNHFSTLDLLRVEGEITSDYQGYFDKLVSKEYKKGSKEHILQKYLYYSFLIRIDQIDPTLFLQELLSIEHSLNTFLETEKDPEIKEELRRWSMHFYITMGTYFEKQQQFSDAGIGYSYAEKVVKSLTIDLTEYNFGIQYAKNFSSWMQGEYIEAIRGYDSLHTTIAEFGEKKGIFKRSMNNFHLRTIDLSEKNEKPETLFIPDIQRERLLGSYFETALTLHTVVLDCGNISDKEYVRIGKEIRALGYGLQEANFLSYDDERSLHNGDCVQYHFVRGRYNYQLGNKDKAKKYFDFIPAGYNYPLKIKAKRILAGKSITFNPSLQKTAECSVKSLVK